jgi:fluoroacetyl-CoA thioesterase
MPLQKGLRAVVEATVGPGDTAAALGSGDVAVLGTPRVVALAEAATIAAVAAAVGHHETTVGSRVELEHLAPSPVGAVVRAEAVLEDVAGRRLSFEIRVTDGDRLVARGTVVRVLVDRARFAQASTDERG